MLFYTNFIDEGVAPTKNAEDGLLAAYGQAPFAFDLRMMAAGILLYRGDKDGARTALLPVAYSPHRASYAAIALEALTAINAGDIAKAKAALNKSAGDGGEQDGKDPGD
jgi:Flp pilus assembly protein TadD